MNSITTGSNCTRCGKPRFAVSTHEEKIDNSVVTFTQWECKDPECQKEVNKELKNEKNKRKNILKEQQKREEDRKKVIEEKKLQRLKEK
jgi:hypothetical protein